MMRTVALLLACVALAAAVPTDHKVNHVTSAKHISNHENAKQALKMLQAKGTDASACRELSETTKKEVEDEVNTLQAVIDGLDDGANCHTEGQTAVDDAAKATHTAAVADESAAAGAATSAATALDEALAE